MNYCKAKLAPREGPKQKTINSKTILVTRSQYLCISFDEFNFLLYKNLFLRKKSSWPSAALDLAWVEKGEVISDSAAPKSDFLLCVKLL